MSETIPAAVLDLLTRMRDRLWVLAMEDADMADQADAAALAEEADALLKAESQKMACHCDLENTISGEPDDCVFDNGDVEDCIYAERLQREGKGKGDCKYWQPVTFVSKSPTP